MRHRRLNTLRAVKFIKSSIRNVDHLYEANLLKNLKHSGVPVIFDIEEDDEGIYVIEEYIEGHTLTERINNDGKLRLREACEITMQLCDILEFLHGNREYPVAHLDLKPDNVMIDKAGHVKLIDFGNSVIAGASVNACTGSIFFAAPEQYHRLRPDLSCDIYGVGMLLLFMLTGRHEWSGMEGISSVDISKVIKKCVHHNPVQRYRSAGRINADIKKILKKGICEEPRLSLKINLTGAKRGAGTTHIAFALTHYLTRRGIKAVYADRTGRNTIYDFLDHAELCNNAAYSMFGIDMLPDYGHYIEPDEDEWKIMVCDCGDRIPAPEEKNTLNVLIGTAKEHERAFFERKMSEMMQTADVRGQPLTVILNHMSGRQCYSYLGNSRIFGKTEIRVLRMPCKYEWHIPDELSDALFESLLEDHVEVKKAINLKIMRKWRMMFERIQGIFRQIIRR